MKYRSYASYRRIDAAWGDAVPGGWTVKRLRFVARLNPGKSEVTLAEDSSVSFVPMEAVGQYGGLLLDKEIPLRDVGSGYTYFAEGDVLVAKITPCFENGKGAIAEGLPNRIGFGTTELHVIRAGDEIDRKYLFYLSISHPFRKLGEASMYGAGGQKRVPEDFILDFPTPVPSLSEQRMIAAFLDRETARIDALIEKKRRLLALLEEKRLAIITRAVTKGLDPDVPMKDSGIEWLGDVPAHWALKRLKFISPQQSVGVVVNPSSYVEEHGSIPFIYGANIREYAIDVTSARRISEENGKLLSKSRLSAGDLLVVRVGAPGVAAVVPPELEGANCASVMFVRKSQEFDSDWLCHVLNSRIGRYQVELVQYGAAQKQFNIEHAVDFAYPVPPLDEQRELVGAIKGLLEPLMAVSGRVTDAIRTLTEYRSALITSAVTGKIDVRNLVEDEAAA